MSSRLLAFLCYFEAVTSTHQRKVEATFAKEALHLQGAAIETQGVALSFEREEERMSIRMVSLEDKAIQLPCRPAEGASGIAYDTQTLDASRLPLLGEGRKGDDVASLATEEHLHNARSSAEVPINLEGWMRAEEVGIAPTAIGLPRMGIEGFYRTKEHIQYLVGTSSIAEARVEIHLPAHRPAGTT